MPANKKHLTKSGFQRFLKILAGLVGGFVISEVLFMNFILWFDSSSMIITLRFAGFLVWAVLLLGAFFFKSGWKSLGVYAALCVCIISVFLLSKNLLV